MGVRSASEHSKEFKHVGQTFPSHLIFLTRLSNTREGQPLCRRTSWKATGERDTRHFKQATPNFELLDEETGLSGSSSSNDSARLNVWFW